MIDTSIHGALVFDLTQIRTRYGLPINGWRVDQGWSVNSYSDALSPAPAVIYVDDARIDRVDGLACSTPAAMP